MKEEPTIAGTDEENPDVAVAPEIPEELIKGDWRRRLVLPNQDGQLRLTSVKTVRRGRTGDPTQIRFLDDKRRHSA